MSWDTEHTGDELDWSLVDGTEAPFSLAGFQEHGLEGDPQAPDYGNFDAFTREAYASGV